MTNIHDLTLEDKAALTSGADAWHLQGIPDKDIPGYMITDGPHGLRKMRDGGQYYDTVPATCFPPAAGLANAWNPELARRVGVAMGEECVQEKVAVILGPGINIKRNPLGGRCFEYWSEDPCLAAHQAAALVEGVQSQGVGTSLKHFAANNQETDRMRVSVRVSERALREIYLSAFEYVVKHADPWTIMCSYNRINDMYSSENTWLLTDVLRNEWGYRGLVMSDWGAVHNRVASIKAGLNLEMPPSDTDEDVAIAVRDGLLNETQLDNMANGVLSLLDKVRPAMEREGFVYDAAAHNRLARCAAQESIVLLKNENGILPLSADDHIAVIGEFARTPRYQGGGSSHITPTRLTSFLDALHGRDINAVFASGFTLDDSPQLPSMTREAVDAARGADKVLLFLGLPEFAESEGYDRTTLDLPSKQIDVLHAVRKVNPNIVVVLSNGSVVSVADWQDETSGLLESWLLGQAGGEATADVLYGDVDATGRLAQTIPMSLENDPSMMNFPGSEGNVDYGEGVFVGYRHYDTQHVPVAYPFGYGLSYTTFAVEDMQVDVTGRTSATVRASVTNTGKRGGSQTIQLYIAPRHESAAARPVHELKAFAKVELDPGESTTVRFELGERDFSYWSERHADWHAEAGAYRIELGFSSRDVVASTSISIEGDGKSMPLSDMSNMGEWMEDPIGRDVFMRQVSRFEAAGVTVFPQDEVNRIFFRAAPLNSITSFMGPQGRRLRERVLAEYANVSQASAD
ncbi:glycoside hydrolase family 3 C-terminal domain-containing protein [Bifidobacterium sp. LC6]|uniref:Glycoside hydrolase family 3 C-terminal domain-containing protein n=1 Tax=Bifidobacterium colobi TaxID=2809026 RepID=A0ABS5UW94_9BIFI|nr:glycoside hydrolase family 3 C-terminal domain-containing protein [Bifidobacterium colobi]MBT1175364.1 glycoside hydrolase family 3 C-terminal domain-containing protein [Bifidobacterium colobi]